DDRGAPGPGPGAGPGAAAGQSAGVGSASGVGPGAAPATYVPPDAIVPDVAVASVIPTAAPPLESDVDDLGTRVRLDAPPRRVVSLVPSLTESVAASVPGLLAGATDYCTHPAGLDVPRVGGSKYPDLDRVRALHPDLVLANAEENRPEDIEALRTAGIPVWVTAPATLAGAFTSLRRMLAACGLTATPAWLDEARRAWSSTYDGSPPVRTAAVPIWRRPWMVLGAGTFAGDVLRQLGVANAFAGSPERYPRVSAEEIRASGADLVVLPDEPYAFSATDGPEEFAGLDVALVSGRHLTWYGPSLLEARDLLERQLGRTSG
ncbi:MAG TPA: helical backbone metal receptor, partial [Mycobacteriales bacterium]|nr:helical backbone metal receptor [Mycobacteriales bacterium]